MLEAEYSNIEFILDLVCTLLAPYIFKKEAEYEKLIKFIR